MTSSDDQHPLDEEVTSTESIARRRGRARKPVVASDDSNVVKLAHKSNPNTWQHVHFERSKPINWKFAKVRPALGRAMLDMMHALSSPGDTIATRSTALAYQTQTKPFFLWLGETGPDVRGKLPGADDLLLNPRLLEEFRIAMDLRATNGEITGTTAYAYRASPLRILRQMYLRDREIFGAGWRDEDLVIGDRVNDTVPNEPYSLAEARRIIDACSDMLTKLHKSQRRKDEDPLEIAAFIIIGLKLGIEAECLPLLTLADIRNDGDRIKVRYVKRRGGGGHGFRKSRISNKFDETEEITATGSTFREAAGVLSMLRNRARSRQKSRVADNKMKLFTFICVAETFRHFSDTLYVGGLRGDNGERLPIVRNRLRPTWRTQRTIKHGGRLSIDRSDNSKDIRAKHYLDNPQIRPFLYDAIADAQAEAMQYALDKRVIDLPEEADADDVRTVAAKLETNEAKIRNALGGKQDVWLASCTDFTNSPFDKPGTPCTKSFFGCVLCPNALMTRRSLPAILGFKAHMERRREEMAVDDWDKMYAASWLEISTSILLQFSPSVLAEAQAIAEGLDMHLPPELIQ